ncbi:MAG: toll/interleukin-1 receptor domain-containing protein [Pyrinomonadaceae bacterium]
MKVFISHSGTASRLLAEALSNWLQRSIQAVKPFYSPEIDKGAKWSNEIDDALEGTRFGIICLTPDNLKSEWIHYESGALSKTKDASIWTFLLDLKPSDVKQPLGKFQHTLAEKADVLKMLKSINKKVAEAGENSVPDNLLEEIFEEAWGKLEKRLNMAKEAINTQSNDEHNKPDEIVRNNDDKLNEILEILRAQQRKDFGKSKVYTINGVEILPTDEQGRPYKGIIFDLIGKKENYTEQIMKEYILQFFPNASVLIGSADNGFFTEIYFERIAGILQIKDAVKLLQTKTGYKISNIAVITAGGIAENFEIL